MGDHAPSVKYTPRIWTADELAKHTFTYSFLVHPVIPAGGIAFFHGKRAIGKTHFALTMTACINAGGILFGRYQTRKHTVVYIQADMPHQVQQQRVQMAQTLYPLDGLHFYFPVALDVLELRSDSPLVDQIRKREPGLIVWDTLRKVMRGSTNDDDIPSMIYGRVRELFPGCTHLFIHHDKKTIVDQSALDRDEWFRGSGAWLDDADTGLHLTEAAPGRLVLQFTKLRTCGEQEHVALTLNERTLLLYASGNAQRFAEAWVHAHGHDPDKLYRHLLDAFVCSPQLAKDLARDT